MDQMIQQAPDSECYTNLLKEKIPIMNELKTLSLNDGDL